MGVLPQARAPLYKCPTTTFPREEMSAHRQTPLCTSTSREQRNRTVLPWRQSAALAADQNRLRRLSLAHPCGTTSQKARESSVAGPTPPVVSDPEVFQQGHVLRLQERTFAVLPGVIAIGLIAAEPSSASAMMPATRDITISTELFVLASLMWTAMQITGTMFLSARFMMSWFPQVEKRRGEEPWTLLSRPTDQFLDPVRRFFGQGERALVRVRAEDGDAPFGKSAGRRRREPPPQQRLVFNWLGGVDVAPVAVLALLSLTAELLGPSGVLMGTDMPEDLRIAHDSVSVLQTSSLLLSWYFICARVFCFI